MNCLCDMKLEKTLKLPNLRKLCIPWNSLRKQKKDYNLLQRKNSCYKSFFKNKLQYADYRSDVIALFQYKTSSPFTAGKQIFLSFGCYVFVLLQTNSDKFDVFLKCSKSQSYGKQHSAKKTAICHRNPELYHSVNDIAQSM